MYLIAERKGNVPRSEVFPLVRTNSTSRKGTYLNGRKGTYQDSRFSLQYVTFLPAEKSAVMRQSTV